MFGVTDTSSELSDEAVIPVEQATTSASKPAQQLPIVNRPERSITSQAPCYEDEQPKKTSTPTNEPSVSDYHVYRQGAVLHVINTATGRKETAYTLGPKWPVLKRQFLEGRMILAA